MQRMRKFKRFHQVRKDGPDPVREATQAKLASIQARLVK